PQHVVFGFTGAWPGFLLAGEVQSMIGGVRNADYHYYDMNQVSAAVACAYAVATRPYQLPNGQIVYNPIALIGHGSGGGAARDLAVALGQRGVTIDLMVTADAWHRGAPAGYVRPCNVARLDNYYQNTGEGMFAYSGVPVRGARNIPLC